MKVSRILSTKRREIITIRPDNLIREAVALLAEYNIGVLVVLDETEKLVGILSERDIVRQAVQDEKLFARPVSEIMTQQVITGVPQDDIAQVMHTMTERRFRHLPILKDERLIGIVSIGDLVKVQRDEYMGEIDTLETQLMAEES
ncbi:MAG: CBS domain-containing protein [Chloroflexota bacterium]|jgi:CBS domain-containing protein